MCKYVNKRVRIQALVRHVLCVPYHRDYEERPAIDCSRDGVFILLWEMEVSLKLSNKCDGNFHSAGLVDLRRKRRCHAAAS